MLETLYAFAPYAPLAIFLASVLDIFFLTGIFLSGGALLGAVVMMVTTGMISVPELIVSAALGTVSGNQLNYWIGRYFHTTSFVTTRIASRRGQQAEHFLRHRGLLLFMLFGRFFALARPFHGLIIGSFHIRWWRFSLYDLAIASFWVVLWLGVILLGQDVVLNIFEFSAW